MVLLIAQAVTPAYVGIGEWKWENAINLIQESSPNRVSKTCPLPQYAPSQQVKKKKNRKRDELKYQRFRLTITHFSKSDGDVLLVPEVRAQAPEVLGSEGRKLDSDQMRFREQREGRPVRGRRRGWGWGERRAEHKHKHVPSPREGRTDATSPFPAPGPRDPPRT